MGRTRAVGVVPNVLNADDARWLPVEPFADPGMELNAMRGPTVKRIQEIQPIAEPREIKQWPISKWIFDLGQNMVGRVQLKISGPAGTTITLRHAEMLNPDGTLYTMNLRRARQTDHYTLKGSGEEIYEPSFTFHGFRYVELSGYLGQPTRETITGIVLHSDTPPTGQGCSVLSYCHLEPLRGPGSHFGFNEILRALWEPRTT